MSVDTNITRRFISGFFGLAGDDVAGAFDPAAAAALKPAPFPGEDLDARLEKRFAGLSAKVG